MSDPRVLWSELENDAPATSGIAYRRLKDCGPCGIRLQLERPQGTWGFELEVSPSAIPAGFRIESTKGFTSSVTTVTEGGQRRCFLRLAAASQTYNDVFCRLADDVLGALSRSGDEQSAVQALTARLQIWERFFKLYAPAGLSAERQRGLFAEVLVLSGDVLPRMTAGEAVDTWSGPHGRPHDFICPKVSLEVKSSLGPVGGSVEISGARQLDETNAGRPLVLVVVHLEVASAGGESLPQLVNRVAALIESSSQAVAERFQDTLRSAGWDPTDADRYDKKFYSVRRVSYYRVDGSFPRLVESSLPSGVIDVRYLLSLGACEPYRIDDADVHVMLTS